MTRKKSYDPRSDKEAEAIVDAIGQGDEMPADVDVSKLPMSFRTTREERFPGKKIGNSSGTAPRDGVAGNKERVGRRTGNPALVKGGPTLKGAGRPKGSKNGATRELKEAMFRGMELAGSDGKGSGGVEGYFFFLAWKRPELFTRLLERLLPLTFTVPKGSGSEEKPLVVVYETKDDILNRMRERGLPPPKTLDVPASFVRENQETRQ